MTEERDPKVSAAYRELGAQEPPRALDDAILSAARREVGSHPAPLVAPTGRRRWFAPLAAAAVLVLAVSVTLHMQQEQPDVDSTSRRADPSPPPTAATPAVRAPAVALEPKPFKTDQPSTAGSGRSDELRRAASGVTGSLSQPIEERAARDAQAAPRAPQAGPAPALAKRMERAEVGESAKPADSAVSAASADRANRGVPAAAPARMHAQTLADTPERELERIAELRRQGKHDEADKALAEFRRRYPDYRIPEAMRERVERR